MKAIVWRRDIYAIVSVAGIFLSSAFMILEDKSAAIVCVVCTAAAIILLCIQCRLLFWGRLICDSRILTVASSVVCAEKGVRVKNVEETVVSTFGLLLGDKVYRWGCEGINGVRLREVKIDKSHMRLIFGADNERVHVKLLHGVTKPQEIMEITKKIMRETGVQAVVSDWE